MANKLVDLGLEAAPPVAQGGNHESGKLIPLAGNFLRVDLYRPLSFVVIRTIEVKWVDRGRARLIIMRPDGRGGYTLVYRTPVFDVTTGTQKISVPRWWVLEGDRLAVWSDGNCLGGYQLRSGDRGTVAIPHGYSLTLPDLLPQEGKIVPHAMVIRVLE